MWGRYRRWPRVLPLLLMVAFAATMMWLVLRPRPSSQQLLGSFGGVTSFAREGPCEVVRVIDGDTFVVRQPATEARPEFVGTVRMLGANTPETVKPGAPPEPLGLEATKFTTAAVAAGNVRLQLDKRRVDRYGRFLAYVYVGDEHLAEQLIAAGLARVHTYPGDSMTVNRQLLRAQDEARNAQRGIWGLGQTPVIGHED